MFIPPSERPDFGLKRPEMARPRVARRHGRRVQGSPHDQPEMRIGK